MSNQYSKSNSKFNFFDSSYELNLETIDNEWSKDIDEASVCCSTPRNKLCIQAFTKMQEKSNFGDLDRESYTSKAENKTILLNGVADSNIILKSDESQDLEARTSQQADLLQDVIVEQTITNSSRTVDLSMRQDVVNKASLRHMKKFYVDVFKQQNLKLVRARFCNAKSTEISRAIKRTFDKDFETESLPVDFYHYLIGVLKVRNISLAKCSNQTKREVFEFLDCSRKYSKLKFEALFKSRCLRILCRKFLYHNIEEEKYKFMLQEIQKYETN